MGVGVWVTVPVAVVVVASLVPVAVRVARVVERVVVLRVAADVGL